MMQIIRRKPVAIIIGLALTANLFAGNTDRTGEAGAQELLINPWARSSGQGGANSASITGLESTYLNVAGIAFIPATELIFSHSDYLVGTGININAFGFTQKIGETGALALSVMSMTFGQIPITTVDQPDGGLGTFSPSYVNLGLSYAKRFSDNIAGGLTMRVISEAISNVAARGVAFDAGVQYTTGKHKEIHFGVALKNVGPNMEFSGDGLSFRTPLPENNPSGTQTYTVENRSQNFELPSLINIGLTYDLFFSKDTLARHNNRFSISGSFVSNAYSKDQFILGAEYAFRSWLMLRAGFVYEQGIFNPEDGVATDRTTLFTGPAFGITFEVPLSKSKSTFGFDYSYTATDPFQGVHTIGVRINL